MSKPVLTISVFLPRFLINLFAYVYGSIINGHLLDLNIIIPFSIDKLSLGNPATDHVLINTSSPNTFFMVTALLCLIYRCLIFYLHSSSSSCLYSEVNGPAYETIPAAIKQSPISNSCLYPNTLTVSVHLTFSPSRPLIIFSALINFLAQSSISADNYFSCLMRSSIYFYKLANFSLMSLTFILFSFKLLYTIPNFSPISAAIALLGLTIFNTS